MSQPRPPGGSYTPDWYMERGRESSALRYLGRPGAPVVVVGPTGYGKTWFLEHMLAHARRGGQFRAVHVDLREIVGRGPPSLHLLLFEICVQILRATGGESRVSMQPWLDSRSPQSRFRDVLEQSGLLTRPLALALDQADAVVGHPFQNDFFGFLRSLVSEFSEPWQNLRLLLATTDSPSRLVRDVNRSPFNLTTPIRLTDLDSFHVDKLAKLQGLELRRQEIQELMRLVGGHPYLVQMCLYRAGNQASSFSRVLQTPEFARSLYEDFLTQQNRTGRQEQWSQLLQMLLHDPNLPVDQDVLEKLDRVGLLVYERGSIRLRFSSRAEGRIGSETETFRPLVLSGAVSTENKNPQGKK